jgi:hypothetical protein
MTSEYYNKASLNSNALYKNLESLITAESSVLDIIKLNLSKVLLFLQ